MSVDTEPTTTPLAPIQAATPVMTPVTEVTEDTKRRLPKPARKRVAHRLVAGILSRILDPNEDSDGFDLDLGEYTADDADAIFDLISEIAKDHERRSL